MSTHSSSPSETRSSSPSQSAYPSTIATSVSFMSASTAKHTPDSPTASSSSSTHRIRGQGSRPYHFSTLCTTVDSPDAKHRDQWGSSSVPVYQTATFKGMGGEYDYSRSGNPTRRFLEHHIAKISMARHAFAVTSGMGALDVIFRVLKPGDEIIAGNDLYGGSNRLLGYLRTHNGIITHHVDTTSPSTFLPYLHGNSKVRLVLLESPTNPLLQIADIAAISTLVHDAIPEALVVVDNTMMSPYLQRPLEYGADVVYDSGTKYLSGHHDLMAGVIVCNREDIAKQIAFTINSVGNGLTPWDSFLLLRGIKTLALRMDRQQASAQLVATYLHSLGFPVNFPGLASHPGRAIHDRLASGPGAVLSFRTHSKSVSERVVGGTRLWGISVSFGCVNSLISMPCLMSHASIDEETRRKRGMPEDLIRLCVGIEDPEDLLEDLEAALLEAGAVEWKEQESGRTLVRVVQEEELENGVGKISLGPKAVGSSAEAEKTTVGVPETLVTSAPGKVILFGEHAVVHGVTAIAGSVDLRCFCSVSPLSSNPARVSIRCPELSTSSGAGLDASWAIEDLPWHLVEGVVPDMDAEPNARLLREISEKYVQTAEGGAKEVETANATVVTFLYLFLKLAKKDVAGKWRGQEFIFRSGLPIGAGLGSSAAFSASLASALLYSHGYLSVPPHPSSTMEAHHHGRRSIPISAADTINSWAFVAEKILHGNPSGVDNTVAVRGGAIAFRKKGTSRGDGKGGMEPLSGFKSVRFLLVDTKVPRSTMKLVAGVRDRLEKDPELINSILDAIQTIADSARLTLTDSDSPRSVQLADLEVLVDANHDLLRQLGVSHPALEAVRQLTRGEPFGLKTKLTGAGGGGCAVTVVPDGFEEELLERLKSLLGDEGFETYDVAVGGSGVGLVLPTESAEDTEWLRAKATFGDVRPEGLREWAEDVKGWAFV